MKKILIAIIVVILLVLILIGLNSIGIKPTFDQKNNSDVDNSIVVTDFDSCVAKTGLVLESYPRQCKTPDGKTFVENIGNELEKTDLIQITNPRPNQTVKNPIEISGQARGYWFFEASFPIVVVDWDGKIIGSGIATADGEWMTEDFVPFTALISYDKTQISGNYSNKGSLILQRDNPSGLPENDDALEIPVIFE